VRLRANIVVSILALMTIVWGVRFALAQEHRRTPQYLQGMYQELNKQFFENALPTARVEWADLTDADAMGQTFQESDDSFVIQVDRNSYFFWDGDLQDTLEHETCHIATWNKEQEAHGAIFQACMARIKAHS
jgi:predicted SprT family Zn-dependent metalloprotease